MEQGKQRNFVVTVLQDNAPVCVIEIHQRDDRNHDIDLYYPDTALLPEVKEAIIVADHSLGYEIWKRTGQIPAPPDIEIQHPLPNVTDFPF